MENLRNNKAFWMLIGLVMFNFVVFAGFHVVVNKAADKVLERLQKDYSPSPYGPGFDPDKVDLQAIQNNKSSYTVSTSVQPQLSAHEVFVAESELAAQITLADNWRNCWESDRGVNP